MRALAPRWIFRLDEIPPGLLFLITAGLWALLVLIVCSEFNLLHVPRSRMRQLAAAGNRSAQLGDALLRNPERLRILARSADTVRGHASSQRSSAGDGAGASYRLGEFKLVKTEHLATSSRYNVNEQRGKPSIHEHLLNPR